jgi:indole-3-glycerol phosphate synthase
MVLDEILKHKREEVERSKQRVPLSRLEEQLRSAGPIRPFAGSLRRPGKVRIIAELKKASPSAGLIRPDFEPAAVARTYERNGAAAMSVLTDRQFFQGELDHLSIARNATELPALRKDFVIDAYQVSEARSAGADAVLLIVRVLSRGELRELLSLVRQLGMDALVETHNEAEVDTALSVGADVIGINNRDLDTLQVSVETTGRLRSRVPQGPVVVSESGIGTREDICRLKDWGVDAALIGESLMRSKDPGRQLRELAGV